MVVVSLLKLPRQHVLDPVNLGGNVAGGQAGNLRDGGGVQAFEVGEDHVPVKRLQELDQSHQPVEGLGAIGGGLAASGIGHVFQFLEADQGLRSRASLVKHVRSGDVMGNAVDPGAKGATAIEAVKTAPQGYVDFLQKIAPDVGIGFVGARQPFQRGTVGLGRFLIEIIGRRR
jgi:hypothetical protein